MGPRKRENEEPQETNEPQNHKRWVVGQRGPTFQLYYSLTFPRREIVVSPHRPTKWHPGPRGWQYYLSSWVNFVWKLCWFISKARANDDFGCLQVRRILSSVLQWFSPSTFGVGFVCSGYLYSVTLILLRWTALQKFRQCWKTDFEFARYFSEKWKIFLRCCTILEI